MNFRSNFLSFSAKLFKEDVIFLALKVYKGRISKNISP